MQEILGDSKRDNFTNVIDKAKNEWTTTGEKIPNHAAGVGKKVDLRSSAQS